MENQQEPSSILATIVAIISPICTLVACFSLPFIGDKYYLSDKLLLLAIGIISICAFAIPFIFWLKMTWETIPKQHRRGISPNSVFLLFIPVFNLFCSFRVIPTLSKAIRRWRESIEQKATKRSFGEKTGTTLCVFAILLLPVATGIVLPIWAKRMNRQKNTAILKSQGKICMMDNRKDKALEDIVSL